ncbi:hypothetical protein HXA34_19070 [Salipaludibacillus agaradhaerens]|uniref:hypothetical protein n=1 Tax=Salipaludibacillus agaradhaerens TaxID=76935 RepID=UPI0021515FCB|nr:hypothetical protein [Salipaludibacillus agaradhaerens]MCR6108405.1 hypothetical protein [Salipaludibacillus agaradhaerens]MCR6120428.1 hypothetical protein [Salipaludibacillus agaradhaerens]UJW59435.1 hypothetical protein HXZ66_19490 [Bacillus sp. A116_S68]
MYTKCDYNNHFPHPDHFEVREDTTVGEWVGIHIVMFIPVINIIILVLMLCNKRLNKSLRHFAVATLLMLLISWMVLLLGERVVHISDFLGGRGLF